MKTQAFLVELDRETYDWIKDVKKKLGISARAVINGAIRRARNEKAFLEELCVASINIKLDRLELEKRRIIAEEKELVSQLQEAKK